MFVRETCCLLTPAEVHKCSSLGALSLWRRAGTNEKPQVRYLLCSSCHAKHEQKLNNIQGYIGIPLHSTTPDKPILLTQRPPTVDSVPCLLITSARRPNDSLNEVKPYMLTYDRCSALRTDNQQPFVQSQDVFVHSLHFATPLAFAGTR